jgi:hypothetical protein
VHLKNTSVVTILNKYIVGKRKQGKESGETLSFPCFLFSYYIIFSFFLFCPSYLKFKLRRS